MTHYNYFVLDTETTGLIPQQHKLLSVGIIAFNEFAPVAHTEVIINHLEEEVISLMDQKVTEMHNKSGLIDKVKASTTKLAEAEIALIDFVKRHSLPNVKNILIGNSIGFDVSFLKEHMHYLNKQFYYRVIDVSSLNILAREFKPELAAIVDSNKVWGHTALADCYETLKEFRLYMNKIFKQ